MDLEGGGGDNMINILCRITVVLHGASYHAIPQTKYGTTRHTVYVLFYWRGWIFYYGTRLR